MKNDHLCRLFYIDFLLQKSLELSKFRDVLEKTKNMSVLDIEAELGRMNRTYVTWFRRYKDKSFKHAVVNIDDLLVDEMHRNLDNMPESGGKRIADFLEKHKNNPPIRKRLEFICANFDFYRNNIRHLPVVVRPAGNGLFEVMMGNHRAMAYKLMGYTEMPVLVALD